MTDKNEQVKETIQQAVVVEVIRIILLVGDGTESSPMRNVTEYWDKEGMRLARRDPEEDSNA